MSRLKIEREIEIEKQSGQEMMLKKLRINMRDIVINPQTSKWLT